jgi:hypothetical protein
VQRTTDHAFEFKSGNWQYVIVLPNTPMSQTTIVVEKFEGAILKKLGSNAVRLKMECEPLVEPREGTGLAQTLPAVEEYARQTQFLLALARRAGFGLCVVRLSVAVNVQLPPTLRMKLPGALLAAVRENLGESELAFNLERSGLVIAVLLPGTDVDQGQAKAQELRAAIARKLGGASGPVTVHAQAEELAPPARPATDAAAPPSVQPPVPGEPEARVSEMARR